MFIRLQSFRCMSVTQSFQLSCHCSLTLTVSQSPGARANHHSCPVDLVRWLSSLAFGYVAWIMTTKGCTVCRLRALAIAISGAH